MKGSSGTGRGKRYNLRGQKTVEDAEGSQDIAEVSKKYYLRDRGNRRDLSNLDKSDDDKRDADYDYAAAAESKEGTEGSDSKSVAESSGAEAAIRIPMLAAEEKIKIIPLNGHNRDVTACTWNREGTRLASSCADGTVRIWTIPTGPLKTGQDTVVTLETTSFKKNTSAPIIDWKRDGTHLATGCLDGNARIWTSDGTLVKTLSEHKKRISCIKWSDGGERLITGSDDHTFIVWEVGNGRHARPPITIEGTITGVDWKGNNTVVTSSDKNISVWTLSLKKVIESQVYPTNEAVNGFKWNTAESLLAASLNDRSVKVFDSQGVVLHDFTEHTQEISSIKWCPNPADPNQQSVLASSSLDSTIKVWDVTSGTRLHEFNHGSEDAVYNIAFSPDGNYLASGTKLGYIYIWSVEDERLVKKYKRSGIIYDICWGNGGKIAACSTNNSVYVLDFIQ